MNADSWHKRDHHRALLRVGRLDLVLRGILATLQDLILVNGGPIKDDDDRHFAGQMRCSQKTWRKHRDRLIGLGEIWRDDLGFLHDDACDEVLAERAQQRARLREAGAAGGRQAAENRKKSMVHSENVADPSAKHFHSKRVDDNKINDVSLARLQQERERTREERVCLLCIDDGWSLDSEAREIARANGIPEAMLEQVAEAHRAYWRAEGARKKPAQWMFIWQRRCQDLRARPDELSRLRNANVASTALSPRPIPENAPLWWRQLGPKICESVGVPAWNSYWSTCIVGNANELTPTSRIARDRLREQATEIAAKLSIDLTIFDPPPQQLAIAP